MSASPYSVRTFGGGYAVFRDGVRVSGSNDWGNAHKIAERMAKPLTPRACLRCRDEFQSEGAHHRMCGKCRVSAHDIFEGAV